MATHPYHAALDEWRRRLSAAFAEPDGDVGEVLVWAAAAVAAFIARERKERLRAWARDIRRWKVLPRSERERLVAAGLRYCALFAGDEPVEPAPPTKPKATARATATATSAPATREGSLVLGQ